MEPLYFDPDLYLNFDFQGHIDPSVLLQDFVKDHDQVEPGLQSPLSSLSSSLSSSTSRESTQSPFSYEEDYGVHYLAVPSRSWDEFRLDPKVESILECAPLIFEEASPSQSGTRRPSTDQLFSDGESDDGNTKSDPDYRPSPELVDRKRNRSRSITAPRKSVKAYTPKYTRRGARRVRLASSSRNQQASPSDRAAIEAVLQNLASEKTIFICPCCDWEQDNRRIPDFKRHLNTHLRGSEQDHHVGHWCKGVPLEEAHLHKVTSSHSIYIFRDHERIGGCMQNFSRADALKRHLGNSKDGCLH